MTEPTITRRQLSDWARLTQKKYRREQGRFLIEGDVCLREALRAKLPLEAVLILASEFERWQRELPRSVPAFSLNAELFARFAKVESSQGIVAVARCFQLSPKPGAFALACEQVSDPGNAGALIRVADFFGASELILGPASAEVWNSKVVRGSMGSLFHQPMRTADDFAAAIRMWPGSTAALVAHGGESLRSKLQLKPPVLLVLGHETRGLSQEFEALCSHRLTLPSKGQAESLNLVTAAAVFAFAFSQ
jgi:RNA methyltransferase, TrmH family